MMYMLDSWLCHSHSNYFLLSNWQPLSYNFGWLYHWLNRSHFLHCSRIVHMFHQYKYMMMHMCNCCTLLCLDCCIRSGYMECLRFYSNLLCHHCCYQHLMANLSDTLYKSSHCSCNILLYKSHWISPWYSWQMLYRLLYHYQFQRRSRVGYMSYNSNYYMMLHRSHCNIYWYLDCCIHFVLIHSSLLHNNQLFHLFHHLHHLYTHLGTVNSYWY